MSEEIVVAKNDIAGELSADAQSVYCSIQGGTREQKALIYNSVNNPTHKVGDFINKTINVKDVVAELIELPDEVTGELALCKRVVLIDDKGESYQAVSEGIFNAIKKAIKIFGAPTWNEPLPVLIKQVKVRNGSMLTFDIAI